MGERPETVAWVSENEDDRITCMTVHNNTLFWAIGNTLYYKSLSPLTVQSTGSKMLDDYYKEE